MSKMIKYRGRTYIAVDSTETEVEEEYKKLKNEIRMLNQSSKFWMGTNDPIQIENDIQALKDMQSKASKLLSKLEKLKSKIKKGN